MSTKPERARLTLAETLLSLRYRAIHLCLYLVTLWMLGPGYTSAQNIPGKGTVEGSVFIVDAEGRSYVPGAKVTLQGPKLLQTDTHEKGQYSFREVDQGQYTVVAIFPGLQADKDITIGAGVVRVELELKPVSVQTSVTVSENSNDTTAPIATETIAQKTIDDAPNANERFESLLPLVPGVVRGPDGRINMKGARSTQSGALVNSANVTDPATGQAAINLPIDVVSSVQVISDPYDPQYGKLAGAVSSVETKTSNYEDHHFTIQNVMPRPRFREGSLMGLESATPRMTYTGPLIKGKIAITESFEYRFVRTPVTSLPPLKRDQNLEGFNSYTQLDFNISNKQTATMSVAVYPQKLQYLGLNTFTPQPSTTDYHQRGYQIYGQDRYLTGLNSALTSQISYKTYDADTTPEGTGDYQLLIDTTEGEFFNQQRRRTNRFDWQESYAFAPREFLGTHRFKAGMDYSRSTLDGRETFFPASLVGSSGSVIERITFTQPESFNVHQNEAAFYASDEWSPIPRVTLTLGLRSDTDSVTESTHVAPRGGMMLALTKDGRTLLKAGGGIFYDRVPLMYPVFGSFPDRTVSLLNPNGAVLSATPYTNRIVGQLQNPRSTAWNVELERQVTSRFTLRASYEERNTTRDFVVSPTHVDGSGYVALSNKGSDSYREFQITGSYRTSRFLLNGSYVRSRASGDLNDPFLFFGNYPQAVIQPDGRGRLSFDAPNRFIFWGDFTGPWKLDIVPVWDIHTGFPYSTQDEYREYLGPRDTQRYPRFSSADVQVTRPFTVHMAERHLKLRAGVAVFNVFNHDNPRDVQTIVNSSHYGDFYNDAWRTFRGKLVFQW